MTDLVQVEYEQLQSIVSQFARHAEVINKLKSTLQQSYDPLYGGDWEGKGAGAFFNKMTSEIFPSVDKLNQALQVSSQITQQVMSIFQAAEQDAAALFRGGADDMTGGGGAGGAGAGAGGGSGSMTDATGNYTIYKQATKKAGELDPAVVKRWNELTPEQQAAVLQKASDEICAQYKLKPVKVSVVDLYDPPGMDAMGEHREDGIYIDVDNMNDPNTVIDTVAHEVQHEIQYQFGQRYVEGLTDKSIKWPHFGVSQATAKVWKENFDNYISPDVDFAKYEAQPIEVDARRAGAAYRDKLTLKEFEKLVPKPAVKPTPRPTPRRPI